MDVATELPYAVKPTKVIFMVQHEPPPKPACFDTMDAWQEYLMYLEASGTRITRRQDLGKHSATRVRTVTTVFDRIDFCQDCHIGGSHQLKMQREGRCIIGRELADTSPAEQAAQHWAKPPATRLRASFLTARELDAAKALHQLAPYVVAGVSSSILSLARHSGGCTFNGCSYTYMPATDECVRDDVLALINKLRRSVPAKVAARQGFEQIPLDFGGDFQ